MAGDVNRTLVDHCWSAAISWMHGHDEELVRTCWSKCRLKPITEMQWVYAGRNLFKLLVAPEQQRKESTLNLAKISNHAPLSNYHKSKEHVKQLAVSTVHGGMMIEEEQTEEVGPSLATSPVSKEDLGRATWTFLHTLAAQFPDKPTRQQQKDVRELMAIVSRLYPCKECADHFKEVLKNNPVQASSGMELAQWMCRVHNIVNRSLGKPQFPCQRVDARWGALHCDGACDLQGRTH